VSLEDLFEAASRRTHKTWEKPQRARFPMALAYSRHTCWGGSWT
jgi:hypothetical protein